MSPLHCTAAGALGCVQTIFAERCCLCCLAQKMYTEEVFHRWFNELAKMKIIPDYPAKQKSK